MEELKPCPFCGSNNIMISEGAFVYAVGCRDCHGGFLSATSKMDINQLIIKWNSRFKNQ